MGALKRAEAGLAKKRPAVIVSNQTYQQTLPDVVLLMATSQIRIDGVRIYGVRSL